MTPTIYSHGQGMGYVSTTAILPDGFVREETTCFEPGTILPGMSTDLFGFFAKPMRYMGIHGEHEMIFYIGSTADLFGEHHYWQGMIYCSRTRIFSMYSNNAGRDYNYVKGKWK